MTVNVLKYRLSMCISFHHCYIIDVRNYKIMNYKITRSRVVLWVLQFPVNPRVRVEVSPRVQKVGSFTHYAPKKYVSKLWSMSPWRETLGPVHLLSVFPFRQVKKLESITHTTIIHTRIGFRINRFSCFVILMHEKYAVKCFSKNN